MLPGALEEPLLAAPLYQRDHARWFVTLFTAVYDPCSSALILRWPKERWEQSLQAFTEGRRTIAYDPDPVSGQALEPAIGVDVATAFRVVRPFLSAAQARRLDAWCEKASNGFPDWANLGAALRR
jgi:hypothetical protein